MSTSKSKALGKLFGFVLFSLLTVPFVFLTASANTNGDSWLIPYGEEFWQKNYQEKTNPLENNKAVQQNGSGLNLGNIVDRVSHAFEVDYESNGHQINAKTYSAKLVGNRLHFFSGKNNQTIHSHSTFQTRSIRIGESVIYRDSDHPNDWYTQGNTAQALLNAEYGLIEHYDARENGVKLTWVLSKPPAVQDEILVTMSTNGLTLSDDSDGTLHYETDEQHVGVKIGDAVTVDSNGQRWTIPMTDRDGIITLTVSKSIASQAQFPLAIDPTISPVIQMNDPVVNPHPDDNTSPLIATNDMGVQLVIWRDFRNGNLNIYGTRLDQNGNVLDINGLEIIQSSTIVRIQSLASDGVNFFVVWQDNRNGISEEDLFASRITNSGKALDPSGIAISTFANDMERSTEIAWNGNVYFIAWVSNRNDHGDIFGVRVTNTGVLLDPNPFLININDTNGRQNNPNISTDGQDFFVVWGSTQDFLSSDIRGARINDAGIILDNNILINNSAIAGSPNIAWNGVNYLVSWNDDTKAIFASRVSSIGIDLDTIDIPVSTANTTQEESRVASDGNNYFVTWQDLRNGHYEVYGSVINSSGVVSATDILLSLNDGFDSNGINLDWNGNNYIVTYQDYRNGNVDIYGTIVNASGVVQDQNGYPISTIANYEASQHAAYGNGQYLVVWGDNRNGQDNQDIYGVRVSSSGVVLDATAIPISTAANNQTHPYVAFDGANFVVAWNDNRNGSSSTLVEDIYATRVTSNGTVLDANGKLIVQENLRQISPRIAWSGSHYQFVWGDNRFGSTMFNLFCARVDQNLYRIDATDIQITNLTGQQQNQEISWDGQRFLVVWADNRNGFNDIYGSFIESNGTVSNFNGFSIIDDISSATPVNQDVPRLTWNGQNHLLTWNEPDPNTLDQAIKGTFISPAGAISHVDGFVINDANRNQIRANPVWNGNEHVVVWWDDRANVQNWHVYGTRVDLSGNVLDTNGFLITEATNGLSIGEIRLASAPEQSLAVYPISNDTFEVFRSFGQLISFQSSPAIPTFSITPPTPGIDCDSVREYTVSISDASAVVGYRVAVVFNASQATYVPASADILNTSAFPDFDSLTVNATTPGQLIFTNASDNQPLGLGEASILKFSLDFADSLIEGSSFTISFLPITNLNDGAIVSDTVNLTETVNPINDPPTFSIPNPFVQRLEDEGAQSIIGFSTNISPGDPGESGQQITFQVAVDDESLFAATPVISSTGTLSFTSAPNANGITSATVYLTDDGGVANCGIDTSTAAFFTIEILPVNDQPTFTLGSDQFFNEDDPAQTIIGFATNISVGPVNEATQSYGFLTSTSNDALFATTPIIDVTGTLTYTPAANANGSATVTVVMKDDGGTANGGIDQATKTFNITIFAVNDEPTIAVHDLFILEDSGLGIINVSNISDGEPELDQLLTPSFNFTNPGLIASATFIMPASSSFGSVQIVPASDEFGSSIFTLTIQDNGSGTFPNDNIVSASFVLNVSPVNDAPSFIVGASQNILNVTGSQRTVVQWASGITAGPTNEVNQLLNFSVDTDQPGLFAIAPAVTPDGTLTFTPAPNAHGIANVSLSINDDGGTAFGGDNSSATDSFTITSYTQFLWGDLNIDNVSGTVDASLILRFDAALLPAKTVFGATFQEFLGYPIEQYPEYFQPRAGTLPFSPLSATFPLAFPPAANVAGNDNEAGVLDAAQLLRVAALLDDFVQSDTSFDGIGPDQPIFLSKQVSRSQVTPRSLLVDLSAERSDTVSNAFTAWNLNFFVDNGEDLSGFRVALNYDPSLIEVDEFGVEALSGAVIVVNDTHPGRLIVSGALINIPGAGPAELLSIRMVSASNSETLIDSITVDVDESLTRLNDGAFQLSTQSIGEVLLSETTDVTDWMLK